MTDTERASSNFMLKLRVQAIAMLIGAPVIYLFIGKMFQDSGKLLNHGGWKIELMFYLILLYIVTVFLVLPRMERAQIKMYHKKYKHKKTVFKVTEEIHIVKVCAPGVSFIVGFVVLYLTGDWWRLISFYVIGFVTSIMLWPYKQKAMDILKRIEEVSA